MLNTILQQPETKRMTAKHTKRRLVSSSDDVPQENVFCVCSRCVSRSGKNVLERRSGKSLFFPPRLSFRLKDRSFKRKHSHEWARETSEEHQTQARESQLNGGVSSHRNGNLVTGVTSACWTRESLRHNTGGLLWSGGQHGGRNSSKEE